MYDRFAIDKPIQLTWNIMTERLKWKTNFTKTDFKIRQLYENKG